MEAKSGEMKVQIKNLKKSSQSAVGKRSLANRKLHQNRKVICSSNTNLRAALCSKTRSQYQSASQVNWEDAVQHKPSLTNFRQRKTSSMRPVKVDINYNSATVIVSKTQQEHLNEQKIVDIGTYDVQQHSVDYSEP